MKIRSDIINKSVCGLLAKLNLDPSHYDASDCQLVSHALAYGQFDLVAKISRQLQGELVVRKFLATTNTTRDPNYIQLLARLRLEFWLDHDTQLRLIDHLLHVDPESTTTVLLDRSLLDSIANVLIRLILGGPKTEDPKNESIGFVNCLLKLFKF